MKSPPIIGHYAKPVYPRWAAALALGVLCAAAAAAPKVSALDAILDPSIGLKELSDLVREGAAAGKPAAVPAGRFFLLTGRLGIVIDRGTGDEGAEFIGESELVGGEWQGTETVRSFRAYLRLVGNRFAALADDESPGYIPKGSLVVVIGSYEGMVKEYGSDAMAPVLNVERIIPVN
jgi:hypothetical protein